MNIIYTIASILAIIFVLAEFGAAVVLYRRRHEIGPRLRSLLGLNADAGRVASLSIHQDRLERKVNYIGRHVKFEREQLRRMGILKDEAERMAEQPKLDGIPRTARTFPRLTE